jgi:hypothetical protein
VADAVKRNPKIDPYLFEIDAINSPILGEQYFYDYRNSRDVDGWLCAGARVWLTRSYWHRFDRQKFERVQKIWGKECIENMGAEECRWYFPLKQMKDEGLFPFPIRGGLAIDGTFR